MTKEYVKGGLSLLSRFGCSSLGGAAVAAASLACPCGPVLMVCRTIAGFALSEYAAKKAEESISETVDEFAELIDDVKDFAKETE